MIIYNVLIIDLACNNAVSLDSDHYTPEERLREIRQWLVENELDEGIENIGDVTATYLAKEAGYALKLREMHEASR